MSESDFDRDAMAREYAEGHIDLDEGIHAVYYLPTGSPEKSIRLLEVNELVVERDAPLVPLDFGVNGSKPDAHKLLVVDVTPGQWERIGRGEVALPKGWSLDGAVRFTRATA